MEPSRVRPNLGSLWAREGPNGEESETNVNLGDAMRQKSGQLELPFAGGGEAPTQGRSGDASTAAHETERSGKGDTRLMERVVERSNVIVALKRVQKNKGSPGIDGMTVEA